MGKRKYVWLLYVVDTETHTSVVDSVYDSSVAAEYALKELRDGFVLKYLVKE